MINISSRYRILFYLKNSSNSAISDIHNIFKLFSITDSEHIVGSKTRETAIDKVDEVALRDVKFWLQRQNFMYVQEFLSHLRLNIWYGYLLSNWGDCCNKNCQEKMSSWRRTIVTLHPMGKGRFLATHTRFSAIGDKPSSWYSLAKWASKIEKLADRVRIDTLSILSKLNTEKIVWDDTLRIDTPWSFSKESAT